MSEVNPYQVAYERERTARKKAEKLLDEKSASLFENYSKLQQTLLELKTTQQKLIQSEKLASIGQLAAGVAHEINNPVGYSLSNVDILRGYFQTINLFEKELRDLTDGFLKPSEYEDLLNQFELRHILEDIPELLQETTIGLHRISDIVRNLNKVSYSGGLSLQTENINHLIEDSIKVISTQIEPSTALEFNSSELPPINVHTNEIHQVFINLFLNAAHACQSRQSQGIIKIDTYMDDTQVSPRISIDISDNGVGIPSENLAKIFDPFFTTKDIGSGTGLGLSTSLGIIKNHGGNISVESKLDFGTTFKITLPILNVQ